MFESLTTNGWMPAFSSMGKEMFLAPGIFHWTARAKNEATIDATIGSASGPLNEIWPGAEGRGLFCLSSLSNGLKDLSPQDLAAYAPIGGVPAFQDMWKQWILDKSKTVHPLTPELITKPQVLPGITMGLYLSARLFLDPGQSIVLPDKRWDNYDPIYTRNLGLKIESFPLFGPHGLDYSGLEAALMRVLETQDHAVTVANFPNNPTGFMPQKHELEGLAMTVAKVAENTGKPVVVICDDAYEGFTFDNLGSKGSPFYVLVGCHEKVIPIKLDGLSKEFFMYGGRISAMTIGMGAQLKDRQNLEKELETKVQGLIRTTLSNCPRAQQQLWVNAMKSQKEVVLEERGRILAVLKARCLKMKEELDKALAGKNLPVKADPFNAGFFAFLNLEKSIDPAVLGDKLLKEYKTGIIPVSIPEENVNGIRVAFCSTTVEEIPTLVSNIVSAIEGMVS